MYFHRTVRDRTKKNYLLYLINFGDVLQHESVATFLSLHVGD